MKFMISYVLELVLQWPSIVHGHSGFKVHSESSFYCMFLMNNKSKKKCFSISVLSFRAKCPKHFTSFCPLMFSLK